MIHNDSQHNAPVVIGLTAVVVAVTDEVPRVIVARRLTHDLATPSQQGRPVVEVDSPETLPFGPFLPAQHRTLELGLRHWVAEQTGLDLRYVEQLYTFGNQYRDPRELAGGPRVVSVAYLALTHESPLSGSGDAHWCDWYSFLPWEDWRQGRPRLLTEFIMPRLQHWITGASSPAAKRQRHERAAICFGFDNDRWDYVRSLERYELLYEAGLLLEALRDRQVAQQPRTKKPAQSNRHQLAIAKQLGAPMALDNRRILASALGRLRGKLTYRPLVFELVPSEFTLFQLQRVVEALSGVRLHKSNFRRTVMNAELVEPTGHTECVRRGRPAELYCFRADVIRERPAVGIGVPAVHTTL